MRITMALSMAAVALLLAGPARADEPSVAAHEFHVTGMTCSLCAKAIEKGLRSVDGVREVQIDRKAERVRVVARNDLPPGVLEAAIEAAGSYEADLLGSDPKGTEDR
jgi:copper chaperone